MKRVHRTQTLQIVRLTAVVAGMASLALILTGCAAKPSTRTPGGTLQLLLKGAKTRNVDLMKSYCKGMAINQCEQLIAAIEEMEKTGKASKFDSWNSSTGPTPTSSRSNAFADLFGVNHDLFMRVSVTLERDNKNNWKIDQMVWESKRQE